MARQSRPPGFDMTYRPERRIAFGPPLRQRAASFAYLAFAVAITAGVAALWIGHHSMSRIKAAVPPGGSVQKMFRSLLRATSWRWVGKVRPGSAIMVSRPQSLNQ